jgi:HEAT repeat protein
MARKSFVGIIVAAAAWLLCLSTCSDTSGAGAKSPSEKTAAGGTAPPRVKVSKVPFYHNIVLKPGDACTFELPNGKTVAVWGLANTGIMAELKGNTVGFGYGEEPFKKLEREEIQLPNGATTGGEYISYIRQGSVFDGGFGNPSEYILYVENYRISLKEKNLNSRNLPMTVSVRLANEKEQVTAKNEVDFYIKRLNSPDPGIQIDAIHELRMLLMLRSIYAVPRWKEIIEAIRPLSLSTRADVKAKAAGELLILGDVRSLLEVILPEPRGKWRTEDGAISLATYSQHFGKDKIYAKVLPFLESEDPELFRFALAFFSQVKYGPAKPYMEKALRDEQANVRLYAFWALLDLRADAGEMSRLVSAMLDDKDEKVLQAALREAGRYNDLIPPKQMCKHLAHEAKEVRLMAAYALECCRNPKVIEPLLGATKDQEATVRARAAVSLGRNGAPAAYARLVELLGDPAAEVRESAINGLRWLGDPRAIPAIKKLEKSEPDRNVKIMAERTVRELSRR